jgi:agmatine/peptidylarginine deiminase
MSFARFCLAAWILFFSATTAARDDRRPAPIRRIPQVFVTADELANPHLYHPRPAGAYRPAPPPSGPPPEGVLRPAEFEQIDSTVIAVLDYGDPFLQMWTGMVGAYSQAGHTWIIADSQMRQILGSELEAKGIPQDTYSWLNYPIDSIWIRDYGPEFAIEPDGTRHIVDAYYTARPLDDAIPGWIAASDWIGADGSPLEIHGHEHMLAGGNNMSDGAGTCFFSDIVYSYEKPIGWTEEAVDQLMKEYLGCEQMIVLNPICLDGTGHIDLFAKLVGPNSILLGRFSPDTHFNGTFAAEQTGYCSEPYIDDYQDQEDNLAIIEASTDLNGDSWQLTRVPMPEPYQMGSWWIYRSYLNSEMFNDVVAMPSYYTPHGEESAEDLLDLEAEAIAAYETAAPGVTVVPIDSDHIISLSGAIHCISHEIPHQEGWEPPEAYCGDGLIQEELDEQCDGSELAGRSCEDLGFDHGQLGCDEHCRYDPGDCGDLDGGVDTDTGTGPESDAGQNLGGGNGAGCGCSVSGAETGWSGIVGWVADHKALFFPGDIG